MGANVCQLSSTNMAQNRRSPVPAFVTHIPTTPPDAPLKPCAAPSFPAFTEVIAPPP
jgi:hypothetical protein